MNHTTTQKVAVEASVIIPPNLSLGITAALSKELKLTPPDQQTVRNEGVRSESHDVPPQQPLRL